MTALFLCIGILRIPFQVWPKLVLYVKKRLIRIKKIHRTTGRKSETSFFIKNMWHIVTLWSINAFHPEYWLSDIRSPE
jgi:hypothetical protein